MSRTRDHWWPVQRPDVEAGIFPVRRVGVGGVASLVTFRLGSRFAGLVLVEVLGVPSVEASTTDQDIDVRVDHAGPLEAVEAHTASDTTTLYDLAGLAGAVTVIAEVAHLVTAPAAGHLVAVQVRHNGTAGPIDYLGVRVVYAQY